MNALDELVAAFSRLPGLGKKSAARIAYWLLRSDRSVAERLAARILDLKDRIVRCSSCGCFTEADPCAICTDPARDRGLVCVVEQPQDVETIDAAREYHGLFHVLGGLIAPLDGVGPEQLSIGPLMERVRRYGVREVIVATNPTVEGDTTALYLQKILKESGVAVSRLASGLPVGGDLEYADRLTIARSLRGRTRY